ncbi:NAD(P)H-hydrate dehydratase [Tunturiibacter gelidoferens]|uniref:Bifunctional NAD(P)H-hydrate repair enzyme n=3 Tax=Tunturiibacter TaxID=3154218 RepID=A0A7Y9NL04_9BACT|nr:NAD(P)H-hydrate dehydratase [Edaphobacter lichenicola]MBB5339430.1 NAD(P)H-hydrate epimerase [Edaphobacter lichenicola]NYF51310.1 NAD(P)H-hydrate epimerase [Edaphobacter lichenicola]
MKILTATEMQAVDRWTAEEFGVSLDKLMEAAGEAVAQFCLRQYPVAMRVVVLCGKGNNGGDGFVAARVLAQAGRLVRVVLLGRVDEVRGEAATALKRLMKEFSSVEVDEVGDEAGLTACANAVGEAELLLDALVGTGFKPPLRGLAVLLREMVEKLETPVVAVDLPSGWDANSVEQTAEGSFRADAVVTFTAPKIAHVFGHLTRSEKSGGAFGPVVVAAIGSPEDAVVSASGLTWAGASKALAERPRDVNSNKGKFGHVLVVGGSYGKAGAPAMASLACLRAGAGLVTAAVPKSILDSVTRIAPELMMVPLAEGTKGAVSFKNLDGAKLDALVKRISVVAVGPGLSTEGDAPAFARQIVEKTTVPVVIDADALNAFEGKTDLLNGEGRVMVLTPHPGEMARLAGMTVKEVEADRVGLARRFATKHKLTLVLKGWRTLIAHPDGSIAVNTSGNPAMAKGGSGDILTGIVAAMLAQFPNDVARAVETAVYLHGLAADYAAHAMDEHTVLATDTVTHLSDAFRYRVRDEDGLVWICGLRG